MRSGYPSRRYAWRTACLLTLPLALSCPLSAALAMPPLGYTGEVQRADDALPSLPVLPPVLSEPPAAFPPLGYTGPVPHQGPSARAAATSQAAPSADIPPPLGYTGEVQRAPVPAPPKALAAIAPNPFRAVPAPTTPATSVSVVPPPAVSAPRANTLSLSGVASMDPAPAPMIVAQAATQAPPTLATPLAEPMSLPAAPAPRKSPAVETAKNDQAETGPVAVMDIGANHASETLITAQEMHSDSAAGIVTATGNVEIVRSDYVLHADKVTYNQNTGVMTADGHVSLLTPSGDVEFSDHQEVTGDMKQAFANNVGILMTDNSRVAAKNAQKYDGRYTVANHAAYTACNICREHPEQEPLWQMKSASITHDNVEHKIYYHDTTIDFAGVPIAYTPYMSGPDPTVKRLQGFLTPMPGTSPNIGSFIRVPYYIDIADDKDMTLSPTFSTIDKAQMAAQYRERFDKGTLTLSGSFTKAELIDDTGVNKGEQWRGHVFGNFQYNIDNIWRTGSEIQYASDKSYLHRYNISSTDQTISRAFVEGFKGRDYMAVNSYYFQDLRAGSDPAEPIVMPSVTFSALGDPGQTLGGRWSFNGNTLLTTRDNSDRALNLQGPDTRRLSLNGGWERQFTSDTGLVSQVSGLLRTDSYWANNVVASDAAAVYDRALFTRQFEQGNVVLRYPMGRSGDGYQHLVEPIVAFTAAPNVRKITKQPIEDSLDVEFDETNLFSPNRFTGSDLIEGGSRVTYGVRNAVTTDSGAHIDVFGGESYNFTPNNDFPDRSGLTGRASDYVGRIDFTPAKWMTANYGFRLSQNDFSPQRQDALVTVGAPIFRPSVRYIEAYETDTSTNAVELVRQITFSMSSTFAKYWTVTGSHTQAFDPQPGPRGSSVALSYVNECFAYGVNLSHDDTNRADISSGTSVAFHFYLKNLGGLHTDSVSGINFPAEFRQTAP